MPGKIARPAEGAGLEVAGPASQIVAESYCVVQAESAGGLVCAGAVVSAVSFKEARNASLLSVVSERGATAKHNCQQGLLHVQAS
jgi:hypothetical protein